MNYYFNKTIKSSFDEAISKTTTALADEGFGIVSEIDVTSTFKKKLNVDFHPYRILGACNPEFAHKALQYENKIGIMLPCNVIVQQISENETEIAAVNPIASMQAVENENLGSIAKEITARLEKVIANL